MPPVTDLGSAAHVVQLALTPIFLLTGLASLLNVFTTRLGRVADRVDRLNEAAGSDRRQLDRLRLRSRILDGAVLFAALSGGLTCAAALTLFFGALRDSATGAWLFAFFGAALGCAMLALTAFSAETILSGRQVREATTPEADRPPDSDRDPAKSGA
ncbi:DUF2721 domain-containing protein [uncultured Sphingomonas sp.]|uniref:DUF2721 domain-containing protein n=1 Tax=uncultured Sphingomonas sp. TaxID=158754 RepID=UPI0035CA709B